MRRLLLWMSANAWMRRNIPRLWIARRAVRRFMPGERAEDALAAAAKFKAERFPVLFTRLGENVTRREHHEEAAAHYEWLIEEAHRRGIDGEVSVKLTHLGMDLDIAAMQAHMERLARAAAANGGRTVWIDMEGTDYTEATIAEYERLKAAHANVGICLQAYLKRTYTDIERLLPLAPRIRLVKGAYAESRDVCYQKGREVDANFLALCVSMLSAMRAGKPLFLGLGTHDVALIEQVADHAESIGLGKAAFDVEMLYGIRADQQRRLKKHGYDVRVLIAYGDYWYPWYMRRLAERPANVVFAVRQMLPPW
jgi:proline dehydrogenase